MYTTTDSDDKGHTYQQLSQSNVKLSDDALFVVNIPVRPETTFEGTSIGWRKNIGCTDSQSSYSKSDFPNEQNSYIEQELYWQIQKGTKVICSSIQNKHNRQINSVMCCHNSSFWGLILLLLCVFGGIGLYVYAKGNNKNELSLPAGIMIFGGGAAFLLLLLFRKLQSIRTERLLNEMLCNFEQSINTLEVMDPQNNDWNTRLMVVVKWKRGGKNENDKVYIIAVYRMLSADAIKIAS
eukprot:98722_1